MAEKTLNTRLKLRYDSHENWIANDPVLLAGEVALSTVSVKQDGTVNYVPSVLIKVGDGEHKYSELDFTYAKAADVVAAAKSETALTAYINNVIANSGIATSEALTALSGRVTTAEGKITTLEGKMTAVETKAAANETAIGTLEGLVNGKSVAVQIQEAITALNLPGTYDAKGAAATAEANAKAHATGLNTAMNTRVEALEAIDHEHANKEELDKIVAGDKAKWDAAEQNAKDYADGLDGAMDVRMKAIEAKFGEGEGNVESQIEAAVAAEAQLRENADTGLSNRIGVIEGDYLKSEDKTELQGAIDDLEELVGGKNVANEINTAVAAEKARAEAAEQANATAAANAQAAAEAAQADIDAFMAAAEVGESAVDTLKEIQAYITSDGAAADEMTKNIAANADAIDAVEGRMDTAEGKIATLEGKMTTAEGEIDTLQADIVKKAAQADLESLAGRVTTVENDLNTESTGLKARMTTAEGAIDALEELVGGKNVATEINSAVTSLKNNELKTMQDEIDAVEAKAHEHANKTELDKFADGDKAKLDAAVQTVTAAAGSGLKATKTGTDVAIAFDDTCVFIFDCGDSSNV